jgi:hypothetical protein
MRWETAEAQVATKRFSATCVLPEHVSKRMLLLSIRGWIDTAPTLKRGNTTLPVDNTPDSALAATLAAPAHLIPRHCDSALHRRLYVNQS